jgi:hypothetical protein
MYAATSKAIAGVQGGRQVQHTAAKFWSDAVLLSEAGICRQTADEGNR